MTEIKLDLSSETTPEFLANNLRSRAKYMRETVGAKASAFALEEIAEQIEAQYPKPLPAEPTAFGSIVLGRTCGTDRILWQRDADGDWRSEHGAHCGAWTYFQHDVEVLRVGVDGPPPLTEEEIDQQAAIAQRNIRKQDGCGDCGEQDCNTCWPLVEALPTLSMDEIEPLIQNMARLYGSEPVRTNVLRDFRLLASRCLETVKAA